MTVTLSGNANLSGASSAGPVIPFTGLFQGRPAIASHTEINTQEQFSNGTDTGANFRWRHVACRSVSDVAVCYQNRSAVSMTLRAAIEYPYATTNYFPLLFSGVRDVVLAPGATVVSDILVLAMTAADVFATRTYFTIASGAWANGYGILNNSLGEGLSKGTSTSDLTTSGSIPAVFDHAFGPSAIVGKPTGALVQPALFFIGDSITAGISDVPSQLGFLPRMTNDQIGYVKAGESGAIFQLLDNDIRLLLMGCCTHAICEYGTTDIFQGFSLATLQANYVSGWTKLAARGLKVYQTTITPRTTSTDNWATTGNQTIISGYGQMRSDVNDWIRTTPAPLTAYLEIADAVESARNSGLWTGATPPLTIGGIHPSNVGYSLMAAAINPAMFTV